MPSSGSSVGDGRTVVPVAATRVQLGASVGPLDSVAVQALEGNTGAVVVGGNTVVAALETRRGIALSAGQVVTLATDDLSDVWLDAMVSGEGVTYTYVIA